MVVVMMSDDKVAMMAMTYQNPESHCTSTFTLYGPHACPD